VEKGFTLYELLVVLGIASALAAMSFSVGAVLRDTRLSTTANELVTVLVLARSESVKWQLPVSVCKSADALQCSNDASWRDGWLVFVDVDRNGRVDTEDTIVWVGNGSGETTKIVYRGIPASARNRYVTYIPTGFTDEQNGTFYICDHRGMGQTREVVLYKTGHARYVGRSSAERARNCV